MPTTADKLQAIMDSALDYLSSGRVGIASYSINGFATTYNSPKDAQDRYDWAKSRLADEQPGDPNQVTLVEFQEADG